MYKWNTLYFDGSNLLPDLYTGTILLFLQISGKSPVAYIWLNNIQNTGVIINMRRCFIEFRPNTICSLRFPLFSLFMLVIFSSAVIYKLFVRQFTFIYSYIIYICDIWCNRPWKYAFHVSGLIFWTVLLSFFWLLLATAKKL